ncbi:MAG: hypothetical protein JNK60_04315, partial [Acidobacteria bacterium]|nr:hypothetical protein [Acidobacteriota bacterium]
EIPTVQSREGASLSRYGGAPLVITGLKGGAGSGFRTNVILAETSGAELTARLSLRLADGTQARTRTITVKAYSKEQINFNDDSLFPQGESYDGASLEVTPVEGIGSIAGFATVIDNASQGYTTRAGRFVQETVETNLRALRAEGKGRNALAPRALSRFVIAAAARASGANNSLFTTTVSITNGVGSTANLTLRYLPDDGSTVEPKTLSIPGRRTVTLTDVVGTFFGMTNNTAGMVFVEGADIRKVVVTSDTGTPLSLTDASRGASPSTLAAYAPEAVEALGNPAGGPPSAVVSHPGLEESDRYRTNLILAETTGQPVRVRVKVVPAGSLGQPLAQKEYDLRAFQRLQINRFLSDVAATESGAVQYVDVETVVEWVSGAGRVLAVATKIDNDPNSKRSDIYVLGPTGSNQGTIGF